MVTGATVRSRARKLARAGGFAGLTAAMLPAMLADVARRPLGERDPIRELWVRRWARSLLRLFAVEVVVAGAVPANPGRPGRLLVSNHRSAIDIGVILATFGGTFVSRADLSRWPLVGTAARAVGTVFVDRSSARSGAATIRAVLTRLEQGQSIAVFPEGTTFEGDEVRPFHAGAFTAAVRAKAEILPVGLAYPKDSGASFVNESFLEHLGRMAAAGPTRMVVAVGSPLPLTTSRMSTQEVADRARDAVAKLVHEARRVCGT